MEEVEKERDNIFREEERRRKLKRKNEVELTLLRKKIAEIKSSLWSEARGKSRNTNF